MNIATATSTAPISLTTPRPGFFARTENWLDERGKGAWIAAIVLGFIFVVAPSLVWLM